MTRLFDKLLIANRGEIAVRIIRACRELGIRTVAVYSEADAEALHTRLADESVHLGPPPPTESYLCADRIIVAAVDRGAQAIHPGYGFLAENAGFAAAVRDAGLTFIGPSAEAIRAMGDKTTARDLMRAAGVPVVPGYEGGGDAAAFAAAADDLGYPVLVKAAAGGGGRGMRIVHTPAGLPEALAAARREAQNAFGDPTVYLEKYIEHPRHVEFQVVGDRYGTVMHLSERDCSVQRRHQKIVEESPSPALDPSLRGEMGAAAVAAARAVGYENAGTVEFILDADGRFYFLEMNTRLQVEHPVTELVMGVDLVRLQIEIAAGSPLALDPARLTPRGHALECRIYAEDPANGFVPSTGKVLLAEPPAGPGIRLDAGVASGDEVSRFYDPLLAKLVVWAEDRDGALARMERALADYVLLGVTTNVTFLRDLVAHPVFQAGAATTHFVESAFRDWHPPAGAVPDEALMAAALTEVLGNVGLVEPARTQDGEGDPHSPWHRLSGFRVGGGL